MYNIPTYTIGGELYHHGILGQKWGKRNGPPYPLSESGHSASERKAGYKKSLGGGRNESMYNRSKSTSKTTNKQGYSEIDITDSIIATVISKIAAKRLDKALSNRKLNKIRKGRTGEVDEKTGLKLKTEKMTPEEDLKAVNPLYSTGKDDVRNNCVHCSIAYEMRRRGYDVNANLSDKPINGMEAYRTIFPKADSNLIKSGPEKYLKEVKNFKGNKDYLIEDSKARKLDIFKAQNGINKEHAQSVVAFMKKQPNSRGAISVRWGYGAGHMMTYEVKNGQFIIRDPQSALTYKGKEIENLLSNTYMVTYMRFDNQKDFDVEKLRRYCK